MDDVSPEGGDMEGEADGPDVDLEKKRLLKNSSKQLALFFGVELDIDSEPEGEMEAPEEPEMEMDAEMKMDDEPEMMEEEAVATL